jgi:hypothetical protein
MPLKAGYQGFYSENNRSCFSKRELNIDHEKRKLWEPKVSQAFDNVGAGLFPPSTIIKTGDCYEKT